MRTRRHNPGSRLIRAFCLSTVLILAACSPDSGDSLAVTGQIEGAVVAAGSRIGGRVEEVLVSEGDTVSVGDVLVRIESAEAQAAIAAAEAAVAQAEATLEKLKAGPRAEDIRRAEAVVAAADQQYRMALEGARSEEIQTARANVQTAQAQRDEAQVTFERMQRLYEGNAVAKRMFDEAEHGLEAANGQLRAAQEQLNLLTAGTREEQIQIAKAQLEEAQAALDELREGARQEDIDAAVAARDAAKAQLDQAKITLAEMTIRRPSERRCRIARCPSRRHCAARTRRAYH